MVPIGTESWFAVQVSPKHEIKVATALNYKGYQQFVPTYLSRRCWSDRIRLIQKPLFSGYVFCRVHETTVGLVRTIPGVVRIIGFNGKPSPVPDAEIGALQKVVESGVTAYPFALHLKVGQRVEVSTGPLAGITGTLVQIRNRTHLVISVDLTMRAISVDMEAFEVRVLNVT
jgi:transcription antitermination factor NusG